MSPLHKQVSVNQTCESSAFPGGILDISKVTPTACSKNCTVDAVAPDIYCISFNSPAERQDTWGKEQSYIACCKFSKIDKFWQFCSSRQSTGSQCTVHCDTMWAYTVDLLFWKDFEKNVLKTSVQQFSINFEPSVWYVLGLADPNSNSFSLSAHTPTW